MILYALKHCTVPWFTSVVWSPYQALWSSRFEAVQRRFVRYALPWSDPLNLPPYANRCRLLDLDTLAERRNVSNATFVAKILLAEYDVLLPDHSDLEPYYMRYHAQ